MVEQFCRRFLHRHTDYTHLYDILDSYSDRYLEIDVANIFYDKESLIERFPSICFTMLRARNHDQSYILAILGFGLHVHTKCKDLQWYDIEPIMDTLQTILTCSNFNSTYYCKQYSFCSIL